MKKYIFDVKMHEEYGSLGFVPTWYKNGDPLQGMAVAHDILEHFPRDTGDAEGEFQAFGAGLYIRGETGYFNRNGNRIAPEEHLSSEIPRVWDYHTERDNRTTLRPCGVMQHHETMDQCRSIVTLGMREYNERGLEQPTARNRELMARWIARGYKRATIRYREHHAHDIAYSLFNPIEEGADKLLKHAEEGMQLTVYVDYKNLTVRVWCDYHELEDY